jgi:histidine triad (HIT) family protein
MTCVFCDIVAKTAPATIVKEYPYAIVIVPLNPVTQGHVLVLPKAHVKDAAEDPMVTGIVMAQAAHYVKDVGPCNIITSIGEEATQSVFHLHLHVVPRVADDGLPLPWSDHREQLRKAEDAIKDLESVVSDSDILYIRAWSTRASEPNAMVDVIALWRDLLRKHDIT